MRNQPSEHGKGNKYTNYTRPNTQSTEIRYITRQLSEADENRSSRSSRRSDSTSDTFECVPQCSSSQKRELALENNYKKPSLPYYVVPVLYVPQKVLSSQDIRPTSPIQEKHVSRKSKEDKMSVIDVDKIPCVACESKKLSQQKDNYVQDSPNRNVDLNQAYINADYCKSSSTVLDDVDYEEQQSFYEKRYRPPEIDFYQHNRRRNCKQQIYENFLQHQRRYGNCRNKNEVPSKAVPQRDSRQWDQDCNCRSRNEVPSKPVVQPDSQQWDRRYDCYDSRREKFCKPEYLPKPPSKVPQTCTIATTTSDLKRYEQQDHINYDKNIKRRDERHYCFEEEPFEDSSREDAEHKEYIDLQNYSSFNPMRDLKRISELSYTPSQSYHREEYHEQQSQYRERESVLRCNKAPLRIKKMEPFIGVSMDVEVKNGEEMTDDFECLDALRSDLDDTQVLSVKPVPKSQIPKNPKASQTTFEEPAAYSTYNKNDETIRDSKSTQTVDAKMTSVAAGTQTDRTMRAFATCPPPYIQQIREEISLTMRQRRREASTSPTRLRRPQSPVKQYAGDTYSAPTTIKKQISKNPMEVSQQSTSTNNHTPIVTKMVKTNKRRKLKNPLTT